MLCEYLQSLSYAQIRAIIADIQNFFYRGLFFIGIPCTWAYDVRIDMHEIMNSRVVGRWMKDDYPGKCDLTFKGTAKAALGIGAWFFHEW